MSSFPTHWIDTDEVSVEIVSAADVYPETIETAVDVEDSLDMLEEKDTEEEVEVPRAIGETMSMDDIMAKSPDITLTEDLMTLEETDQNKATRIFIQSIKENGEWARSISAAKLAIHSNPYLTKENISDLLTHCISNVNFRPRSLTITSKNVTLADIQELLTLAFTVKDEEIALNNSIVRIYSKKVTEKLWNLATTLRSTCDKMEGIRLAYNDIFAELKTSKDSVIRFRTSNIKKYCALEEIAQNTKMTIRASFTVKRSSNPFRDVFIQWHDEHKEGHGRVSYVHFDHNAYKQNAMRVSFEKNISVENFEIASGSKMIPVGFINHPVQDLIGFLEKITPSYS